MRLQLYLISVALAVVVQGSPDAAPGEAGGVKALFGSPQLAAKLGVALPDDNAAGPRDSALRPFRIPAAPNVEDNKEAPPLADDNKEALPLDLLRTVPLAPTPQLIPTLTRGAALDLPPVPLAPLNLSLPEGVSEVNVDALFRDDPASPAVLMTALEPAASKIAPADDDPNVSPVLPSSPAGFHFLDGLLGKAHGDEMTPQPQGEDEAPEKEAKAEGEDAQTGLVGVQLAPVHPAVAAVPPGIDVESRDEEDEAKNILHNRVSGNDSVFRYPDADQDESADAESDDQSEDVPGVAPATIAVESNSSPSHTGRLMLASIGAVALAGSGCVCYARRRRRPSPYETFAHQRGIAPSNSVFNVFGRSRTKEPPRQYVPVN